MKLIGARLRIFECFLGQFVSFRVFFADRQQTNAGAANAEDRMRVNVAHDRELFEVERLAVDIGADIEKNRRLSFLRRQNC